MHQRAHNQGFERITQLGHPMRGDVKKKPPLLPCEKLFALHPAQRCGLAAYFLSVTQPVARFCLLRFHVAMVVRCPRLVKLRKQRLLAPDNLPTMILCETRGL